jgi:hypothetical protein
VKKNTRAGEREREREREREKLAGVCVRALVGFEQKRKPQYFIWPIAEACSATGRDFSTYGGGRTQDALYIQATDIRYYFPFIPQTANVEEEGEGGEGEWKLHTI